MSYPNLTIDCHDSNIYVITMRKLPENRLNVAFAQEIIRALRDIETRLGKDAEGAVIIRGSDAKFFCTVSACAPNFFFTNNTRRITALSSPIGLLVLVETNTNTISRA